MTPEQIAARFDDDAAAEAAHAELRRENAHLKNLCGSFNECIDDLAETVSRLRIRCRELADQIEELKRTVGSNRTK